MKSTKTVGFIKTCDRYLHKAHFSHFFKSLILAFSILLFSVGVNNILKNAEGGDKNLRESYAGGGGGKA